MPEGDTIWRTAAALRPRLVGREITRAEPAALGRLAGRTVEAVEATGKHLVIRVSGDLLLHTHMRMAGSWHVYAPGQRWLRPPRQVRALLEVAGTVAVCFNAPVVELRPGGAFHDPVAHLGPDVLAPELDLDGILARVPRSDAAALGELLLDQRVAAGIGNIWRCETLWQLRLDPWAPVAEASEHTVRRCYRVARDLMRRSLVGAGPGRVQEVHGRRGRACRRCGTPVGVRAQGEQARLTYWCAGCQTLRSLAAVRTPPAAAPPSPGRR